MRALRSVVGIDVGGTLAKLSVDVGEGPCEHQLMPSQQVNYLVKAVAAIKPTQIGLTGGGANHLASLLDYKTTQINEFTAWCSGASLLLAKHNMAIDKRYLLVSVGTGTSMMLVDGQATRRVGGTALGGGTILGLGTALLGTNHFDAILALAKSGARHEVDLLVSDIYREGGIALAGDLTASNFGKLAREFNTDNPEAKSHLAQALLGLVGENVAKIASVLAEANQVKDIVYAGSSLRNNPILSDILQKITALHEVKAHILKGGEFAGALGALSLAAKH